MLLEEKRRILGLDSSSDTFDNFLATIQPRHPSIDRDMEIYEWTYDLLVLVAGYMFSDAVKLTDDVERRAASKVAYNMHWLKCMSFCTHYKQHIDETNKIFYGEIFVKGRIITADYKIIKNTTYRPIYSYPDAFKDRLKTYETPGGDRTLNIIVH